MNKTLYIVTPKSDTAGVNSLMLAAKALDRQVRVLIVDDPKTPEVIKGAESILYRLGPKSITNYALLLGKLKGTSSYEKLDNIMIAFNKCKSYNLLSQSEIALPLSKIITSINDSVDIPTVIKPPAGNQGQGVLLVQTKDQYTKLSKQYLKLYDQFLAQEYIPEANGGDKRLVVLRGKVIAAMRRQGLNGEFRSNLSTGGSAISYIPNSQEVSLAIDACNVHGIEFAGVDIVDSHRGPLLLEVNPSPGFGISKIIGKDIASEVVKVLTQEQETQ